MWDVSEILWFVGIILWWKCSFNVLYCKKKKKKKILCVAARWTAVLPQTLLRCSVWAQRYEGRDREEVNLFTVLVWLHLQLCTHEYLQIYAGSLHVCCHGDDDPSWCIAVIPSSGVNTGGVGSYIYDDPAEETQPWAFCSLGDKARATLDGFFSLFVVFVYSLYRFL